MFRAIVSLTIRSIKTVLQLLVLHTYVAAGWYHGSVGTADLHTVENVTKVVQGHHVQCNSIESTKMQS